MLSMHKGVYNPWGSLSWEHLTWKSAPGTGKKNHVQVPFVQLWEGPKKNNVGSVTSLEVMHPNISWACTKNPHKFYKLLDKPHLVHNIWHMIGLHKKNIAIERFDFQLWGNGCVTILSSFHTLAVRRKKHIELYLWQKLLKRMVATYSTGSMVSRTLTNTNPIQSLIGTSKFSEIVIYIYSSTISSETK